MFLSTNKDWINIEPLHDLHSLKMEILSSGRGLFDLSMINPDISPPRILLDKLMEASIKPSNHRYSVSRGINKLRQAFAHKYNDKFNVKLDPESQICVTMGTKDALVNALMCIGGPQDKILLAAPSYPAHVSAAHLAGLEVDYFPISKDPQQMLSAISAKLQESKFRIILINFPNNPSGVVVDRDFYAALLGMAKKNNVIVVNDFVYGEMSFDGLPETSLLSCEGAEENALESYSLSKAYCVPGWRIGALMGNKSVVAGLARLKSHIDYGIFLPLQIAAAAALSSKDNLIAPTVNEYKNRARVLVNGLIKSGWEAEMPHNGAFVWAKIPEHLLKAESSSVSDALSLSYKLLKEKNIMCTPGNIFGKEYSNFVRFALVMPTDRIYEVAKRIDEFTKGG